MRKFIEGALSWAGMSIFGSFLVVTQGAVGCETARGVDARQYHEVQSVEVVLLGCVDADCWACFSSFSGWMWNSRKSKPNWYTHEWASIWLEPGNLFEGE